MTDELKPCPFCGQPGTIEAGWFGCSNTACNVEAGRYGDDGHEAIPAWNTRPIEDALRAELAQQAELWRMEREALIGAWNETSRQLRAEIGSLRALLTQLEWIMPRESWFWQYTQPKYCQLCGRFRHQGHAPDCKLAALLGAQGAQ